MIFTCKVQAYIADTLLLAESCKGGTDRPADSVVELGLCFYVLRLLVVALECCLYALLARGNTAKHDF
jgi:hypothetical protein